MGGLRSDAVGFVGHYGMQNFGDDLFCLAAIHGAEVVAGKRAIICAPCLGNVAGISYVLPRSATALYSSGGLLAMCVKMYALFRTVMQAKAIVYGGGSVITGRKSLRNSILQWLAKHQFIELGAVGVSVGPFSEPGDAERAKALLEAMRFVALRDNASFDIIKSLSVKGPEILRGADLAPLAIEGHARHARTATKDQSTRKHFESIKPKTVAIIPCNLHATGASAPGSMTAKINESLVVAALEVAQAGDVQFVVMCINAHPQDGDAQLSNEIVSALKSKDVPVTLLTYSDCDANEILNVIAECDAVLSVRLHGAISAFLLGTPFVLVEYHKKCTDFLNEIGLDVHLRAPVETISDGKLGSLLKQQMESPTELSEQRRELLVESSRMFSEWPWKKNHA